MVMRLCKAAEGAVCENIFYNEESGRSPGRLSRRGAPTRGIHLTSSTLNLSISVTQ